MSAFSRHCIMCSLEMITQHLSICEIIRSCRKCQEILLCPQPACDVKLFSCMSHYFKRVIRGVSENPILNYISAGIIIIHLSAEYLWLKHTFQANLHKRSPRWAPHRHLKREYANRNCFIDVRVCVFESSVKRLFTISRSQRHKPLDRGYIYFSSRAMSLKQDRFAASKLKGGNNVSLTVLEDKLLSKKLAFLKAVCVCTLAFHAF